METIVRETHQRNAACAQDYLEARHNRLANLMDEVPALSKTMLQTMEAILRICEDKNINPRALKTRTKVTPDGKIFIELNLPETVRV